MSSRTLLTTPALFSPFSSPAGEGPEAPGELGYRAWDVEPRTHTLGLCSWLLGYSEQGGPRPGFTGSLCPVRASVSLHLDLTCTPTALPERPDQTCPWGRDFGAIWHPAREKQVFCCFPTSRISPSPSATPSWLPALVVPLLVLLAASQPGRRLNFTSLETSGWF